MDYKKKYIEAFELMKDCVPDENGLVHVRPCDIFPELKESEDEKMMKIFRDFAVNYNYWADKGIKRDDAIAWIEKHGKQSPQYVYPKFRIGDTIRLKGSVAEYTITSISDGWYHGKGWGLVIESEKDYELVAPKREWSEEDERLRVSCINHIEEELEEIRNDKYGHSEIISDLKESCRERIKWLKSLRPQSQWKPSDEQMKCLDNVKGSDDHNGYVLNTLYNDLKKLREE